MKIYFALKTLLKQEIVCIGWAIDDEAPQIISRSTQKSEKKLLEQFFKKIDLQINHQPTMWIGHHIRFALRFLFQRSVILNVLPTIDLPPLISKQSRLYDTGKLWTGKLHTVSLNQLCEILHISRHAAAKKCEEKSENDVWEYVRAKDFSTIQLTCQDNITACRTAFKKMTFIKNAFVIGVFSSNTPKK